VNAIKTLDHLSIISCLWSQPTKKLLVLYYHIYMVGPVYINKHTIHYISYSLCCAISHKNDWLWVTLQLDVCCSLWHSSSEITTWFNAYYIITFKRWSSSTIVFPTFKKNHQGNFCWENWLRRSIKRQSNKHRLKKTNVFTLVVWVLQLNITSTSCGTKFPVMDNHS